MNGLINPQKKKTKHLTKKNVVQAKYNDITEDYIFEGKPIGKGGYGTVYRAIHRRTGFMRAIKMVTTPVNLKTGFEDGRWGITLRLRTGGYMQ
jgi:hypothetical protein